MFAGSRRNCLMLTAVIMLFAAVAQYIGDGISDRGWLLVAAERYLSGEKLYRDIFESNPPLIVWIMCIPAMFGRWVGMQTEHMHILLMLAMTAFSVAVALRIIRKHSMYSPEKGMYSGCFLALLLVTINPQYFGDREHIFAVLTLPYLLRFMPSVRDKSFSCAFSLLTGLMAGIGFCIKPHFIVLFAMLHGVMFWQSRNWRTLWSIEALSVYVVGILYAAAAYIYTPDYFHVVIPMLRGTYSEYKKIARSGIFFYLATYLLTLAPCLVEFRPRQESPFNTDIKYLLTYCLAAVLYACLNNGWGYTFVPLYVGVGLSIVGLSMHYAWLNQQTMAEKGGFNKNSSVRHFCFGVLGILLLINIFMCALIYPGVAEEFVPNKAQLRISEYCDEWYRKQLSPPYASTFGAISDDFIVWPSLMHETGGRLVTRFHHFWMMPKILAAPKTLPQEDQWIADYVVEGMSEDLAEHTPGVVFVEHGAGDKILQYLLQYPTFSAQWQLYEQVPDNAGCHYAVFRRKASAAFR